MCYIITKEIYFSKYCNNKYYNNKNIVIIKKLIHLININHSIVFYIYSKLDRKIQFADVMKFYVVIMNASPRL